MDYWTNTSGNRIIKSFIDMSDIHIRNKLEKLFNSYLLETISVRNTHTPTIKKENFYHGILLVLLRHRGDWTIKSNFESGDGYSDIVLEITDKALEIIIKMKYAHNENYDSALAEAMNQIQGRKYVSYLKSRVDRIFKYAIACCIKECQVEFEEE